MMAYYPLGGQLDTQCLDTYNLLEDRTLMKIANNHSKICGQVLIRWAMKQGTICILKSVIPSLFDENYSMFDSYFQRRR